MSIGKTSQDRSRTLTSRLERFVPSVFRRLCAEDAGAVAVYVALALVVMIAAIGAGFDASRAYMVRSRLSTALDSAALAGGLKLYEDTRDDDIRMYFETNFPADSLGATVSGPNIVVDANAETVHVSATATVGSTLLRLVGVDDIEVYAESEVTRKMTALDVVLSMDVSGSMGSDDGDGISRLQEAKNAAKELTKILFGNDGVKELLHIGLVPWSSKVNVMIAGENYNSNLTTTAAVTPFTNPETGAPQSVVYYANNSPVPLLFKPPADWNGCVFNRYKVVIDPTDDSDDYDPSDDNIANDADILRGPVYDVNGLDWPGWAPVFAMKSSDGTPWHSDDAYEFDPVRRLLGGDEVKGNGYNNNNWKGRCALRGKGAECQDCRDNIGITPLQNTKAAIDNAVDNLSAGGNTNIPAGLAWAWEVLMPGEPFSEAIEDPDYDRDQAIVLLSDGENCATYGDGYRQVFGNCDQGRSKMNDRLKKLATNIKDEGVKIYAIQFTSASSEQLALMKSIATKPEEPYYYYAPTGGALKAAFREIANHLSELRLSK
ncbi:MAG: VWA domain-containing protein [Hyphomicrobiales bacterium]|nr:VWA domain-containing protein [Hyphomicrobiales bacterium]